MLPIWRCVLQAILWIFIKPENAPENPLHESDKNCDEGHKFDISFYTPPLFARLEKYVNMNFTGFHKILKKHDRWESRNFYLMRCFIWFVYQATWASLVSLLHSLFCSLTSGCLYCDLLATLLTDLFRKFIVYLICFVKLPLTWLLSGICPIRVKHSTLHVCTISRGWGGTTLMSWWLWVECTKSSEAMRKLYQMTTKNR